MRKSLLITFAFLIPICAHADIHGVPGGLVVCVGTEALESVSRDWDTPGYLIQCLESTDAAVDRLRAKVQVAGCYGKVTVERFDGRRLPYIDSLVNLMIVDSSSKIATSEIDRVLAPNGVAIVDGRKTVKPWPADIDEWTHWLYGPENNAVSQDTRVGVSRNLQWIMPPSWGRHHNLVPSMSVMVTAGGRVYYIIDEAPIGVKGLSDDWALGCRDAFNGLELWKKPIKEWGWKAWQSDLEFSGLMRFKRPDQLFRRLVAIDDKLYATLGFRSPVVEIDGATGDVLRVFEGTDDTSAILIKGGVMFLTRNVIAEAPGKDILAVDIASGKMLWERKGYRGVTSRGDVLKAYPDAYLTIGDDKVFFLNEDDIVALDAKSGKDAWNLPRPAMKKGVLGHYSMEFINYCSLTFQDGSLILGQLHPSADNLNKWQQKNMEVVVIDAATGQKRWEHTGMSLAHFTPPDLFVNDGMVWTMKSKDVSLLGLDLATGVVKKEYPVKDMLVGHHHRCYRNKATENFYLAGEEGIEYIDFKTGELDVHHWMRGACAYGILPANGLIYLPTHACGCHSNVKLHGFIALASTGYEVGETPVEERLEKGPAFSAVLASQPGDAWPMYKHDGQRSNRASTRLPSDLTEKWTAEIGGALTQPVVADGRLFVASKDRNEVLCLDAATGKTKWTFTCDGRLDSAPTFHNGRLLFGTQSGSVYALSADDGKLTWRFRAAPDPRMLTAYGRLESPWPVSGSVLVRDDTIYCVAGRSMHLDSGMFAYALDAATGEVLQQTRMQADVKAKGELANAVLPDILVSGDEHIQMRSLRFDPDNIAGYKVAKAQDILKANDGGLLDSTWFNSSFWKVGPVAAQMLVFDDESAYGMLAQNKLIGKSYGQDIFTAGSGYRLFASSLKPVADPKATPAKKAKRSSKARGSKKAWETKIPVRAQSLVLIDDYICLAGAPDVVDAAAPWAAFEGRKGGVLLIVSKANGETVTEHALTSAPVYDGMSAAEGKLFLSLEDGSVTCWGN